METFYQTLYTLGYTHPVHPTMVYLPIGCVMAAVIFGLTAMFFKRSSLLISAQHCINLAFIAALPTIIFGYMDWQYFLGGNLIFPIRMKIFLAALLILLLFITVVYQWKFSRNRKPLLALYTLCFFNVVALGYYGGEIVFSGFAKHNKASETPAAEKTMPPNAMITYAEISDIFHQNCIQCHKGPGAPYDLQLDTYEHVMKGGLEGKVIVPGNPADSELIHRLKGESRPAMPFRKEPLPGDQIDMLIRWIEQGAKEGDILQ